MTNAMNDATTLKDALALYGGAKAKPTPNHPMFPGGLEVGDEERQLVLEVLASRHLFRYYGPAMGIAAHVSKVEQFETEFREKIGVNHALAVNSCTSGLITCLIACGVGPGCEVIVPAYTFFATCSAVVAVGAVPRICDVDDTLTMDPTALEKLITPRTRAIIPVHMRGAPCDMDPILAIARTHGLKVIEDVAQACGGAYKGRRLGAIGDCAAFSLQYHKIITSGEGGVVTTNDPDLYERALWVHDAAACWRPNRFASAAQPNQIFCGYNFRMAELTGAVALAQVRKLEGLLARMREHKARILGQIRDLPGLEFRRLTDPAGDTAIALFFYLADPRLARRFGEAIKAEGLPGGSAFDQDIPDWHIYYHWDQIMQKASPFADGFPYTYHEKLTGVPLQYSKTSCPQCNDLLSRAITIDIAPRLTSEDCNLIARGIRKVAAALL